VRAVVADLVERAELLNVGHVAHEHDTRLGARGARRYQPGLIRRAQR
jgi:hypothetical protein